MPFAEDGQALSREDRDRLNRLIGNLAGPAISEAEARALPPIPVERIEDRLAALDRQIAEERARRA